MMIGTSETKLNPYVGPRSFDTEQRQFFYGRDEEIAILEGMVLSRRASLFFAQSGAGKSSLLRAGLIPRLTQERIIGRGPRARSYQKMHVLPILTVSGGIPGGMKVPISNIFVFATLVNLYPPDTDCDGLADLTMSQGLEPLLIKYRADPAGQAAEPDSPDQAAPPLTPTLLIFDQFEELFTHYPDRWREREGFFKQVGQALRDYPGLQVLFTMREDFIAELTPYANLLPQGLRDRFRLELLKREAALQAVTEPAQLAGRTFAESVAESLVDNLRRSQAGRRQDGKPAPEQVLGAYVEPVHLQIVCRQLWDKLPPDQSVIEAKDVQEFGDVDQALIGFYESTLKDVFEDKVLRDSLSERRLRDWFDNQLITPARTRGLVYRGEADTEGLPNAAVDILREAYIVRARVRGPDTWHELAHDRLVGPVLQANQAWRLEYENPLDKAARAWLAVGRDPQKLLEGTQLRAAEAYAEEHPADVLPEEKELLEESRRQEAFRAEQARQTARRRRLTIVGALIVMAALAALAAFALLQARIADQQRAEAQANFLIAEEQRAIAEENERVAEEQKAIAEENEKVAEEQRSIAEEQKAIAEENERLAEEQARQALSRQLAVQSESQFNLPRYDLALLLAVEAAGVLGEDADSAVKAAAATTALHRALTAPVRTLQFLPHEAAVFQAAWSRDGSRALTVDDWARVWDTQTGEELLELGEGFFIHQAEWNADESRILIAGEIVGVYDADTGQEISFIDEFVNQAVWNQEESQILTAGRDGTARVWDAVDGQELAVLALEESASEIVTQVSWNADESRILVVGHQGTASLWDANTFEEVAVIFETMQATWNRDGSLLLTANEDGTASLWRASTGGEIRFFDLRGTESEYAMLAGWSPDESRILIVGDEGTASVWDTISLLNVFVRTFGEDVEVLQTAWSPDSSRLLIAGDDGLVRVWDAETGEELFVLGHRDEVNQVSWSPDGRLILTAADDSTARVWSASNGAELAVLPHGDWVNRALWSGDGSRILTASWDRSARIWELADGAELYRLTSPAEEARWSADGSQILTASSDGTARVWDADTGAELLNLTHEPFVNEAVWNEDRDLILTASDDGTVRIWNAEDGEELLVLDLGGAETEFALHASWNPGETHVLMVGDEGTFSVWDIEAEDQILVHSFGEEASVVQALWSPAGDRVLAIGDEGTMIVWDTATGDEVYRLPDVDDARWNGDGSLILTREFDGFVWVRDAETAEDVQVIGEEGQGDQFPDDLRWSPDETRILGLGLDAIVWDAETGEPLFTLRHENEITEAIWNQDGGLILTGSWDRTARLWDGETGEELFVMNHDAVVDQVAWNADESLILTASEDQTARVWDAESGDELYVLPHNDWVISAHWNADESRILTVDRSDTVTVFYTHLGDLVNVACSRVARNLTGTEWDRFLTGEPYRATCPNLPPEAGQ